MKPRKPYGANPPGRLPATMIKVLAAELSDQGRLSRGKRYWAEDAVIDIVVGHGAVTAVIQGSRPDPYVVTVEAAQGTGVPSKREVWISCTCPDDGVETEACKHAVAALFALSDEVAIEPALIERWRTGSSRRRPAAGSGLADVVPLRRKESAAAPIPSRADPTPEPADPVAADPVVPDPVVPDPVVPDPVVPDPVVEELAMLLGSPNAAAPPEFPDVTTLQHAGIRNRQLAEVLQDAIDHLAIDWG